MFCHSGVFTIHVNTLFIFFRRVTSFIRLKIMSILGAAQQKQQNPKPNKQPKKNPNQTNNNQKNSYKQTSIGFGVFHRHFTSPSINWGWVRFGANRTLTRSESGKVAKTATKKIQRCGLNAKRHPSYCDKLILIM